MAISRFLAAGSFANNFGFVEMPNKGSCQGYWLFGVSQAASIVNRVNPAAPLVAVGSPTYESNGVVLVGGASPPTFSTPFNTTAFNRTTILVFQDGFDLLAGVVTGFGTPTGGTGGTNGNFPSVPLTGGSGDTLAKGNITVSGGSVVSVAIVPGLQGTGYHVGDVLSALPGNLGGMSGFSVPVATIANVPNAPQANRQATPNCLSWNSGNQIFRATGNLYFYRTGVSVGAPDLFSSGSPDVTDFSFPVTYPDGTLSLGVYRMAVLSERSAVGSEMWLQGGTTFKYTTIAYGTLPVIAASPTKVGGSSDVNSVLRVAALACFTGLTGVQAMQCAKFVQDEVTARGIDFATPAPNMPA